MGWTLPALPLRSGLQLYSPIAVATDQLQALQLLDAPLDEPEGLVKFVGKLIDRQGDALPVTRVEVTQDISAERPPTLPNAVHTPPRLRIDLTRKTNWLTGFAWT